MGFTALCAKGPGRFNYDYRKASLWAENCPNFWPGQAPKGPEKTSVFFREIKKSQTSPDKIGLF
jgi:hypothetical protein